jgi:hypothetical protein
VQGGRRPGLAPHLRSCTRVGPCRRSFWLPLASWRLKSSGAPAGLFFSGLALRGDLPAALTRAVGQRRGAGRPPRCRPPASCRLEIRAQPWDRCQDHELSCDDREHRRARPGTCATTSRSLRRPPGPLVSIAGRRSHATSRGEPSPRVTSLARDPERDFNARAQRRRGANQKFLCIFASLRPCDFALKSLPSLAVSPAKTSGGGN